MNVNEIFGLTIQGEGRYTGQPSIFIRLNGCNLRCAFAGGSLCDTPYTSHSPEKSIQMSVDEVIQKIEEILTQSYRPKNVHLVFTGGEPMLQESELADCITSLRAKGLNNPITIETNGTIKPRFLNAANTFFSLSPKLSTSCQFDGTAVPEKLREQHKKIRINMDALAHFVLQEQYQLKFVYSGEDSVTEIKSLLIRICDFIGDSDHALLTGLNNNTMLMPEGINVKQLEKTSPGTVEACIENGWKFCDRLHIRIWGDKRGV